LPLAPAKGLFFTASSGDAPPPGGNYRGKVLDAVRMVKAYVPAADCVVNLNFSDPVSFLAQRHPGRGPIVWNYLNSHSEESYPSSDRVFAGSSYVLIPRVFGDPSAIIPPTFTKLYGRTIRRSTPVAISKYWVLLRLR
jgi:hypothetical protein